MTGILSPLLTPLLPSGMTGAELHDTGQARTLHPNEAALVSGAGDKRRRDFLLGRICAHAALSHLGRDADVIGREASGAPAWPAGVIGSITHTQGYAAAVAADAKCFARVGLDAERIGGVTENLWPRLFTESERGVLAAANDAALLATLFFSAKECAYKAWQIRGLQFLAVTVARAGEGFTVHHADRQIAGRFAVAGDLLVALAWDACGV